MGMVSQRSAKTAASGPSKATAAYGGSFAGRYEALVARNRAQCRKEHKELRLKNSVPQLIIVLFSVQMINCSVGYRLSDSGAG